VRLDDVQHSASCPPTDPAAYLVAGFGLPAAEKNGQNPGLGFARAHSCPCRPNHRCMRSHEKRSALALDPQGAQLPADLGSLPAWRSTLLLVDPQEVLEDRLVEL